jgi:hypothetical protein
VRMPRAVPDIPQKILYPASRNVRLTLNTVFVAGLKPALVTQLGSKDC